MDKKLGVYICGGCGISESLNTTKLAAAASREFKPDVCRIHPFLCGSEGVGTIRQDVAAGAANTLVIAACSPRVKTDAFAVNGLVPERVNLREQVTWCHKPQDEDTQMLAEDCLRMGITKAQKTEPLQPLSEAVSRKLLVVGGGITGITAALEAAEAGYEVVLVEKQARLGGFVATLKRRFPTASPYTALMTDGVTSAIETATYHPRIQVLTSASIVRIEGQPGMFDVTLRSESGDSTLRVGAIVMATGWKPYDASRLAQLGYGRSPDVVTNVDMERMAAQGTITRPSNGKPVESVLFVQCAGSRDKDHLPYCSSVCCMATLKHAVYIREQNPDAQVYIVYKDMRTPGQYERFYAAVQSQPLNFLTQGEVTKVEVITNAVIPTLSGAKGRNLALNVGDLRDSSSSAAPRNDTPRGELAVTVNSTLLGQTIVLHVDLVVLATGMVPNSADGEAIRALEDAELAMVKGESEGQRAEASRKVEELRKHKGTEILNLTYRQGPDLPVLRNGFADSHFVCFPYETRRTGIYTAGAVRAPMDSAHAREDALGATLKAIQSIELASRGEAVHPRTGDLSAPTFLLQRCTQCKRCTEECPFGALDEDTKGTPKPNLYRCRRCGICMGACPERIVSFHNYSVSMIASMIKSIEVPEEEDEKPRVLVLACENDAYPALDIVGLKRLQYDPSVRVIPLRCLGSLNIVWIADALSRGMDGVMLIGCKSGDDYQCHFIRGSELAERRLENVKETLQRLQLEPERLQLVQLAINESDKLPALINGFVDRIRELGPNPYKGF
jgi:quinone-modifying oxidoreductase subunit QmoB